MSRLPNVVRLAGPERGLDGRSVLSKARAPIVTDGRIGDFWIDTVSRKLFGPKTAAGWPDNGLIRGAPGWYPLERIVTDGARRVTELYDWAGGEGAKPATGYKTAAGALTATIGDAADIRGATGPEFLIDGMDAGSDDLTYASLVASAEAAGGNEKQALARIFGPGGKLDFPTLAIAQGTTVPASIKTAVIWPFGRDVVYIRRDSMPSHAGRFRSADRFVSDGSTDNANGGWWEIAGPVYPVEAFGAIPDNATDATAAINSALATAAVKAAAGVFCKVTMGAGVFLVSGALLIHESFTQLSGAGMFVTILRLAGGSVNAIETRKSAPNAIASVLICDFSIYFSERPTGGSGILVEFGDGVVVERINFSTYGYVAVSLLGCSKTTVRNCLLRWGDGDPTGRRYIVVGPASTTYTGAGPRHGGNNFIYDNDFSTNYAFAAGGTAGCEIGILANAIDGLWISRNYIGSTSSADVEIQNSLSLPTICSGVNIEDNWFDHCQLDGVRVSGSTGAFFGKIAIADNKFYGGVEGRDAISFSGTPIDFKIQGNEIWDWTRDGIRIDLSPGFGGGDISGNMIRRPNLDQASGGNGINVLNGSDLGISGNRLYGGGVTYGQTGIALAAGTVLHVNDNLIRDFNFGASIAAGVDYFKVINNTCVFNGTNAVSDETSTANKTVSGNTY